MSSFSSSQKDDTWNQRNAVDWSEIDLESQKRKKNNDSEWDDFSFRSFDQTAVKTSPLKSKSETRVDDDQQHEKKRCDSKTSQKPSSRSKSKPVREEDSGKQISKVDVGKEDILKDNRKSRSRENSPSPKKRESRKLTKESSMRSNVRSPSVSRREKSRVSVSDDDCDYSNRKDKSATKKSKAQKDERSRRRNDDDDERDNISRRSHRDSSQTPSVRRRHSTQINEDQLSQSRLRAVQRAEARNSWREAHSGTTVSQPKSKSQAVSGVTDPDDVLSSRGRSSLLDQSRRGPIRSLSVRSRHRHEHDTDDDDDFSVLSGTSSSFMVEENLDAPFPVKNLRRASSYQVTGGLGSSDDFSNGSYLPNFLSTATGSKGGVGNDVFHKKERRPSAFGTGHERAQAIYSLKSNLDRDSDDDDESCSGMSVYSLPSGLARSNGGHFEIDRSSKSSASARRPSLSTGLTVPCVNGVDDNNTDPAGNDPATKSDKAERRGSTSAKLLDPDTDSSKKAGANYDSTVEDMLKNRRLRGARGDAAKKTKDEKVKKKHRMLSISMLSNLVQSKPSSTDRPNTVTGVNSGSTRPHEAFHRRPSSVV
jgi:hypothetical protein